MKSVIFACTLFVSFTAFGADAAAPTLISGAGATFPAPLYAKWAAEFKTIDPSVEINYQSIGSGGGVRQFIAGTTDFGATDDPMKDDEIKQVKGSVVHVPMAIGAVVVTYNIPGVTKALKLTPELIADMFMGKITKWDDPKIKALNPDAKLPASSIVPAFRSDGSGTTAVFTEYLATHSQEWTGKVGKGKSVKFAVGLGGKGNEGVTGLVRQNPGAIGYIEMTFAKVNNLPMAAIKNKAGQFVEPSADSILAAASGAKPAGADLRVSILNAAGKTAYPVASFTYLLINRQMDAAKYGKIKEFVKWALGPGQDRATVLHYGTVPDSFRTRALQSLGAN
jgi:phosphate transport system substrate-binding protein